MRNSVKTLIWYLSSTHELVPPIVELGSKQVKNQIGFADLRPFFRDKQYIGCDGELGPGVDKIENIEAMTFKDGTIHTILCLDTIEHIRNPLKAVGEIHRILAEDGILILTSHMYAPVHYKMDYWRFTPQCFRDIILAQFGTKEILIQGESTFPELIAGLASKGSHNPFHVDLEELNTMLPWPYPFPFQFYGKST